MQKPDEHWICTLLCTFLRQGSHRYQVFILRQSTTITLFTDTVRPHQAGYKNWACWNGWNSAHKSNNQFLWMYIDLPTSTHDRIHELFVSMASGQPFRSPPTCSFASVTAKSWQPSREHWHLWGRGRGLDRRERRKAACVAVRKLKVV